MGTRIRPEVSKKRKYWISKHRFYELKHFCLQYKEWKEFIFSQRYVGSPGYDQGRYDREWQDPTGDISARIEEAERNCKLVEDSSNETDPYLAPYIMKAVTENASYVYLRTVLDMPCGKDLYYKIYHKFFWILDSRKSHILQGV